MKFINAFNENYSTDMPSPSHLKLLGSAQTREEVVYRKNGISINKIIEVDVVTGMRVKTTHYDYFDDKKVRSIDEYDRETGAKLRTIDEYDVVSGKKLRTINFSVKDENKISSIQEYDITTGKIIKIFIYKRDGKTLSIIKEIDLETGKVTSTLNKTQSEISTNVAPIRVIEKIDNKIEKMHNKKEDISTLLDNLYQKKIRFDSIMKD